MDVSSFRRIGSVYVILCCLIAGFGATLCLYRLMEAKPACRDFSCPDGTKNVIILGVSLKIGILSAMFAGLLKDGIDERKVCSVRVNRVFVVVRTLSLFILWTCWDVSREIGQNDGDASSGVVLAIMSMFFGMSSITALELWVLNGVQRYMIEGVPEERKKRIPEVVYVQA
ncbi:uncharacterized protein LOC135697554 [Ochlerotatus camptorhynchus]|uniref:uncharacterized protein LOC135697554 n=1 Tax=Ochlerotatus camptorhynchus TaxID=644619 RepID=UPI0031DB32DD